MLPLYDDQNGLPFTAAVRFTLLPSVLAFDFTVQTLAPKAHARAQRSHFPGFKQASSKSTGDIIVTLFAAVHG